MNATSEAVFFCFFLFHRRRTRWPSLTAVAIARVYITMQVYFDVTGGRGNGNGKLIFSFLSLSFF